MPIPVDGTLGTWVLHSHQLSALIDLVHLRVNGGMLYIVGENASTGTWQLYRVQGDATSGAVFYYDEPDFLESFDTLTESQKSVEELMCGHLRR